MKALIIDDESPARAALRGLLRGHPEVTIVGEADTMHDARAQLGTASYDLVFLDIQLRGGTGFDLVPYIRPEARIIFVTAFDQHAVRAFEVNAADYLIKPARPARLAEALRRIAQPRPDAMDDGPTTTLTPTDLVHVKIGNGATRFVPLADIAAIESNENYSLAHLADGTRILVRRTMKVWEDMLPASHFVRVHRTMIVNLARYRGHDRESYETIWLHVEGLAQPVRGSFRYLAEVRTRLEALGRAL